MPDRPDFTAEELQAFVDRKRQARMAKVDAMPEGLRALVNEYGLSVVQSFLDLGVTKPRQIRHVVENILNEFSPTRGSFSIQGLRKNVDDGRAKPYA